MLAVLRLGRDGAYVTDPVLKDSSATYTPGVSERRGTATTFLHSGLKNADTQTGTAQTVSATRRYDAFGNVVTSIGIWNGPFGYAGGFGYQEDATGLKLLGHRYYDSSTGRFLTRDPIKDGRNWFIYCENDPLSGADQNGLWPRWLPKPNPLMIAAALIIYPIIELAKQVGRPRGWTKPPTGYPSMPLDPRGHPNLPQWQPVIPNQELTQRAQLRQAYEEENNQ